VPATLPPPGQALDLSWRIRWLGDAATHPPGAWTVQTRSGRSYAALAADERQFVVDFTGPALDALTPGATVKAVASVDANGELTEVNSYPNPAGNSWRMSLRVRQRDPAHPVELRAFLQSDSHTLSETWSYLIPPP
jgi:glucans biosynthesis protein